MTRQAKVWALYVLLVVLNIFDWQATELILAVGNYEANPMQTKMIASYGTIGIMYFKAPFLLALGGIMLLWNKFTFTAKRNLEIGLVACVTIYSLLAVWHCALMTFVMYRAGLT